MRSYFRKDLQPRYSSFTYPIRSFSGVDADSNEDILPLSRCRYGYNVKTDKGRIRQNFGIESAVVDGTVFPTSLSFGSAMSTAAVYRRFDYEQNCFDNILITQLKNRKIYYYRFNEKKYYYSGLQLSTLQVRFLNYHDNGKDLCLIMTDADTSYSFDGTNFTEFSAPPSDDSCVHGARVYSINGETNVLSFSKQLDPLDWSVSTTAGGNISFMDEGGTLTGIIGFKNSVYIFREYAIHRLNAYVDQADYTLSKVFVGSNEIFFDTVAVSNDAIIFLADDGFYTFDGYTLKRTMNGIFPLIKTKNNAHAIYYGNTYYISADIVRDDVRVGDEGTETLKRNGILSVNVATDDVGIFRGTDVSCFIPYYYDGGNMMLLLFGSQYRGMAVGMFSDSGKLFDLPLKKLWRSPCTDLGTLDKIKVLKRVFLRTAGDIVFTVRLDKDYDVPIVGANIARYLVVNKRAERFGFEVATEENELDVSGMFFEFDFVRRIPNDGNN